MNVFNDFLIDIDSEWNVSEKPKIKLHILGSAALFMQTDYERGTKDGDVFRTKEIDGDVGTRLLQIAGEGTSLAKRHRFYLDLVSTSLPLLPTEPLWHEHDLELNGFVVLVLDVVDVVLSKLRRFNVHDQDDIQAMANGGHIDHARMVTGFRQIIDCYGFDARGQDLQVMVERFNEIEEEWLYNTPTHFELPSWI